MRLGLSQVTFEMGIIIKFFNCAVNLQVRETIGGMLKKAASGVLAILPCSRTPCTLRASKWLRPCWTDFFEHSLQLMLAVSSWACIICHGREIFNSPIGGRDTERLGEKYRHFVWLLS